MKIQIQAIYMIVVVLSKQIKQNLGFIFRDFFLNVYIYLKKVKQNYYISLGGVTVHASF